MSRRAKRSRAAAPAQTHQPIKRPTQEETKPRLFQPVHGAVLIEISERLPFRKLTASDVSRDVLFAAYIDSLSALNKVRSEMLALLDAVATASIVRETELPEDAWQEVEASIRAEYRTQLDVPRNLAGAELGALPHAEIRKHLQDRLSHALTTLVCQFFDGLSTLIDRQLVGLVHWFGTNAVTYRFYRHRIRTHAVLTTVTDERKSEPEAWVTETRRRRTKSLPVEVILECHRHDAVDAFWTSIDNTKVVMPPNVRALIETIPDWMRPSIRIIDGYLIRERNEEVGRKESSVVLSVEEETITEYNYGLEPAVVLGSIVLIGWGPKEIAEEQATRKKLRVIGLSRAASALLGAVVLALQLLTWALSRHILAASLFFLLALLCFAASVFALALSARYLLRSKSVKLGEREFQSLLAGPVLLMAGLQTMLLPGSWAWLLLGVPVVGTGLWLSHHTAAFLRDLFLPSRKGHS